MKKIYTALGTMSGTSMDGVDVSIIQSDGENKYNVIKDKYFEYPQVIYKHLTKLRDKIKKLKDLKKYSKEIKNVEREIRGDKISNNDWRNWRFNGSRGG